LDGLQQPLPDLLHVVEDYLLYLGALFWEFVGGHTEY
jgi:hypothetical protein